MTQRYVYLDSRPDGSPNFDEDGAVSGCASSTIAGSNVTVYIQDPRRCKDCGNTSRSSTEGFVYCVLHGKTMVPEGYCHLSISKTESMVGCGCGLGGSHV